ncbi:MAG: hypothetical protein M0Z39_08070 [Actinomycetota bacterium]|jgi:hypothetical protein|nr:hypothetical protein [Actinomycetota bacterium]
MLKSNRKNSDHQPLVASDTLQSVSPQFKKNSLKRSGFSKKLFLPEKLADRESICHALPTIVSKNFTCTFRENDFISSGLQRNKKWAQSFSEPIPYAVSCGRKLEIAEGDLK